MLGRSCQGNSASEGRTGSPEFPRKPLLAEAGAAGWVGRDPEEPAGRGRPAAERPA